MIHSNFTHLDRPELADQLPLTPNTPSLKVLRRQQAANEGGQGIDAVDSSVLRKAALLELLGRKPVTFQRIYADIAGGVLAAVWLGRALELAGESSDAALGHEGGVFSMTTRECEEATGLTPSQQATCRRKLIAAGLVSPLERCGRVPRYLLHRDVLAQRLLVAAEPLARQIQGQPRIISGSKARM